jgi:hypothetical protein
MNTTVIERHCPGQSDVAAAREVKQPEVRKSTPSKAALWFGRSLSGLFILFGTFDAGVKLIALPAAIEASARLGYPANTIVGIGWAALACLVLYAIPRTAIVGAILWTGYLGGAVASNVRVGSPLFTNALFPVYFAVILWAGLLLRDRRVTAIWAPRS